MQTELSVATAAAQRLKMDGRSILPLMSFVGNALNNLARQTANDSLKRMYLMTDAASVTVPVTNTDYNYYADLTNLVTAPLPIYPVGTCQSDDGGGVAALITEQYPTGLAVTITNTSGNFVGLTENTVYYLIYISPETYKFAATYADAIAGNAIATSTGTVGTVTVTPLNSPQLMLDYLQYGTIFYTYPTGTCVSDDGGGAAAQMPQVYPTGLPVRITNTSGNFVGLSENTTYYIIVVASGVSYKFATSLANALAGTAIVTTTGTVGTVTVTPWTRQIAQWLQSPDQGALTPSIPFSYIYIWLEGMQMYTNATAGNFLLNVPYVPTLSNLPEILESDLIDQVVSLAVSQGYEPLTPAQT